MSPLGVIVGTRTAPPSRGAPTDTGQAFLVGKATTGPIETATPLRSIADFETNYGARAAGNQNAYDWWDDFFREGGKSGYHMAYRTGGPSTQVTALAAADKKLGPGQVAMVDGTYDATSFGQLVDHSKANNRVALLDVANGDTVAQMTTKAGLIPATNIDYGAMFGSWQTIPPPAGVVGGSARQVPASAAIAALCARADALGNPNRAAAGRDFPLQYATGFVVPVLDVDRETLLNAGCNTFANVYGVLENYGFQTKVAQSPDNPFWQFNCARARMWLVAQAQNRGENYMFKPIDARGRLARALKTDLDEVFLSLYQADGLYGETPEDAFATEVGVAVNTVGTAAQGELHAVGEARFSLHAKTVYIDLVTVPITGQIGA